MRSETFGERVRRLRKERELSLRALAKKIGYNPTSLSKVERGMRTAPEKIIKPLAKYLDVAYKELMTKYLSERIFYEVKDLDFAKESIEIVQRRLELEGSGTTYFKSRVDIINEIKKYLKKKPVEKAWVFGSFARKEESRDSDIDILVRFKKPNKLTLLDLVEIREDLKKMTGREVDLVEEGQEIEGVRKSIEKEKLLVYG